MTKKASTLGILFESIIILTFVNAIIVGLKNIYLYLDSLYVAIPYSFIKSINYYIKYKYPKDTKEIIKTKLSTLHAVILFIANLAFIYNYLDIKVWRIFLLYSAIYNGLDMIYLYNSEIKIKNQLLFHHFILIICILPIINDINNSEYNNLIAKNFLCEITTIPLNMSWILYARNQQHTFKFKLYSFLTILLYIPFRICLNSYLSYSILNFKSNFKVCQFMLTGLNYYWFYKMIKKVWFIKSIKSIKSIARQNSEENKHE